MAQPSPTASLPESLAKADLQEFQKSHFVRACLRQQTSLTPIWLMRQAGRYMPKYQAIRSKVGFLDLCKSPELATEVTLMAVSDLGVDAAIIFADILLILEPLGIGLEFSKGDGPVIKRPIRLPKDVELLAGFEVVDDLKFVLEALSLTRSSLPKHIPLIGFAGAPFTLASYLIEGGSSKTFDRTKAFMYLYPADWHKLMSLLTDLTIAYLKAQIEAGASVLQIFDSWVGCLSQHDYATYVLPYMSKIIGKISVLAPVINFGTASNHLLKLMASAGGQVIGLDWRLDLAQGWETVGKDQFAIQGNLDPAVLFADQAEIKSRVEQILLQANKRPGHIFNLGHGILQHTPLENVKYLVQIVHELSHK
jgi:uroporphyrinogen decarboxylase